MEMHELRRHDRPHHFQQSPKESGCPRVPDRRHSVSSYRSGSDSEPAWTQRQSRLITGILSSDFIQVVGIYPTGLGWEITSRRLTPSDLILQHSPPRSGLELILVKVRGVVAILPHARQTDLAEDSPPRSFAIRRNCSSAASRSSTISWAMMSGLGRLAESSRESSLSQKMSRLALSRVMSSS
jgi:hypothetical protein